VEMVLVGLHLFVSHTVTRQRHGTVGWLVCNIAHRIEVTNRSKRISGEGGPRDRGEGSSQYSASVLRPHVHRVEGNMKQINFTAYSVLSFPDNQIDTLLSLYERKSLETPSFRRS
jgi:hypothetical protein